MPEISGRLIQQPLAVSRSFPLLLGFLCILLSFGNFSFLTQDAFHIFPTRGEDEYRNAGLRPQLSQTVEAAKSG